jgi:lantibiotic biosynthesis dehydratase-like protein
MMTLFPVPFLSASVYGQKQHDLLLDAFLRPFWSSSALRYAGGFFWTMRYGGGGEHLKLRLHGPEQYEAETRQALAAALDHFIASLPPSELGQTDPGLFPSIDPEDEEEGLRPDRFWRWTTFRPSPFVLGAEKLAQDPMLSGLYAHTQGAVAEIVLREVAPQRLETSFATSRQSLFIRMLIATFETLGFSTAEREAYLRHHHDWLVRFLIARAKSPETSSDTILAPMRERIANIGSTVAAIRQRLDSSVDGSCPHPIFSFWQQRLRDFFAYVSTFRGNAAYDLDPYTKDYAFLPLFKLLQGACNQFGLRLKSELYVYHLLLVAATGGRV